MRKLRCIVGFHRWTTHVSDDGSPYSKCRDCGKYHEIQSASGTFGMRYRG